MPVSEKRIVLDIKALQAAKAAFGDAKSWGAGSQDALASAITSYLEALAAQEAVPVGVKALEELDSELCQFLNCVGDEAETPDAWREETQANLARLASAYENAHHALIAPSPAQEAGAEPVAWWVHDFHVARQPVKARGKFPEATEYLYPAHREQDAKSVARTLGATCTPLYPPQQGESR